MSDLPKHSKVARLVLWLCVVAAVLYNSWPLGYWLNSSTAHTALASDLERAGQPYYWLFMLGDILAGLCVVAASLIIRLKLWPRLRSKTWAVVYAGLVVFGLFTAVDSTLPFQCSISSVLRCGTGINNGLGLDALLSTIAALGLFASLAGTTWWAVRHRPGSALAWLASITLAIWIASTLIFVKLAVTNGNAHFIQQILIVMYGLALLVIGLTTAVSRPD